LGTTTKTITKANVRSIKIYIPALNNQQSIVTKLDTLSTETKKLEAIYEKKLADLEELKNSILAKAFNGELTEASA
jgi:type I restriction enzyme S subunit